MFRKIYVLTLFPEIFDSFKELGVVGRALSDEKLEVIQIRDFAQNKYKSVDDYPFGGGAGMIMRADTLSMALQVGVFEASDKKREDYYIICPSPRGEVFSTKKAKQFASEVLLGSKDVVFICGRYEGIDERFLAKYVDEFISVGDYILSGGELATMTIIDASMRFISGTLGNNESLSEESFNSSLLEYPQYTKPRDFEGTQVPEVLLSGHHQNIKDFQKNESERLTKKHRTDLWEKYKNDK